MCLGWLDATDSTFGTNHIFVQSGIADRATVDDGAVLHARAEFAFQAETIYENLSASVRVNFFSYRDRFDRVCYWHRTPFSLNFYFRAV